MAASSYEIEILPHSFQSVTDEGQRAEMDGLRVKLAELIEGIDQEKMHWIVEHNAYGEDGMNHHSIFVGLGNVGEAVRRINEAGYATDEDESDDEDEEESVLYDDIFEVE